MIGDRNLPAPYDLIYSNLGSFFALRGIVTVIASYRLVRLDDGGIVAEGKKDEAGNQEEEEEESAVYPSGAQDCGLAIQWAHKALAPGGEAAKAWPGEGKADATKMFALGNSAGGLHLASFLFDPELMSQAQVKMGMEKPLRSAILLGVPFDFGRSFFSLALSSPLYSSSLSSTSNTLLPALPRLSQRTRRPTANPSCVNTTTPTPTRPNGVPLVPSFPPSPPPPLPQQPQSRSHHS